MTYSQRSFDQFGLHIAATNGDAEGVAYALEHGADVNSLDSAGKTALMCAVAGEHWQDPDASDASFTTPGRLDAIRLLVKHPKVSLYTLNAPHSAMNGVIPLGMAAWLNMVEAVQILLEDGSDTVSVDGMDAHGATALMYAARDGNLGVVQSLLSHGARPDFRDCNHRTSIQFALGHPQILWLCESILRRHRWRESQSSDRTKLYTGSEDLLPLVLLSLPSDSLESPPLAIFTSDTTSRMTDTLIDSVSSSNLSFLQSLILSPALPPSSSPALYPMSVPVLVNRPDADGWSPIHYLCAAELPSIDILDSLYLAGADISLFTIHEHHTPLHILAQSARLSLEEEEENSLALYHFIVHLIQDLRAPLSARDRNDETCIHIAAAHGRCINLLILLLDFDTTNTVREMRNAQGLTAFEVAKPEFRAAFDKDRGKWPSMPATSNYTIRPVASFASLASPVEPGDDTHSLSFPSSKIEAEDSTHRLLSCLRASSLSVDHRNDPITLDNLSNLLSEAYLLSKDIMHQLRASVMEASNELQSLRSDSVNIHTLLDQTANAAIRKVGNEGFSLFCQRKARDSEDSELTMFNRSSGSMSATSIATAKKPNANYVSAASQTSPLYLRTPGRTVTWLEGLVVTTDNCVYSDDLLELGAVERELRNLRRNVEVSGSFWAESASSETCEKLRQLEKKHRKLTEKIRQSKTTERKPELLYEVASPKKLTKWIKRLITPEKPQEKPRALKMQIVLDIDEKDCAVGREVRLDENLSNGAAADFDLRIEVALRTSNVVLGTCKRDLQTIEQCLTAGEQFLERANQSIARAERVIKRAVKKREVMLQNLRAGSTRQKPADREELGSPGSLGYSLLSLRPSLASLSSIGSTQSSVAPTLTENDDEDTRAIRRLLLRKVEASVSGAWDEVDKILPWLNIVKEAVRGVKRRAYL